jgi:pimeloyl-ACP methyl ester carboxylesterase
MCSAAHALDHTCARPHAYLVAHGRPQLICCFARRYFNHGYSKSDDTFLVIDENVMVSQVEDLLNHVLEDGEHLHNFVGHSTGGVVAIMAARSLPNRKIDHLGLISPAVWANKPLIAKLGERVPSFLFNLMKWGFKPMDFAVSDSYTQNCHVAFARDKKTKEYRYEAAYKKCLAGTKATFAVHPYYTAGMCNPTRHPPPRAAAEPSFCARFARARRHHEHLQLLLE